MEQWSILSNTLNYIQYDRHAKNYHSLGISAVNKGGKNLCTKEERYILEFDFGPTPDILREEYLDIYERIQSEILNTERFDENSDLSTTYLGKVDRLKNSQIKAEESFSISEQGYTLGKLLDRTECQIFFRHRSQHILHVKILLYALQVTPLFTKVCIKTRRIQVGNGQFVSVLFTILVIIDIHGHRFEICTLVSEIHENIDLVLRIKNVFKLEGVINSQDCCFNFLNRSLPIFPKECVMLKSKE